MDTRSTNMVKCDVANCAHKAVVIVDDHGVDTHLCQSHYGDWVISEITTMIKLVRPAVP
jgi:hypothetical protein